MFAVSISGRCHQQWFGGKYCSRVRVPLRGVFSHEPRCVSLLTHVKEPSVKQNYLQSYLSYLVTSALVTLTLTPLPYQPSDTYCVISPCFLWSLFIFPWNLQTAVICRIQSATPVTKHSIGCCFKTRNSVMPWTELRKPRCDHASNSCRKRLKGATILQF